MSSAVFAQPEAASAEAAPAERAPQPGAAAPAPVTANVTVNTSPMQARLQLSPEDQELIADGTISTGAHIGGGIASLFLGFGIGHAVQGRWGDRGWIFTVGETASLGVMIYGMGKMASSCTSFDESGDGGCGSRGLGFVAGGAIALTAFHVWEVIDAFVAPAGHNRRVRAAQLRAGMRYSSVTPYLTPVTGDGAVGGLSLSF